MSKEKGAAEPRAHADTPGRLELSRGAGDPRLRVTGDWTLPHYARLNRALAALRPGDVPHLDLHGLGALDTAGAALLTRLLGAERALDEATPGMAPERRALLERVGAAVHRNPAPRHASPNALIEVLGRMGRATEAAARELLLLLSFVGLILLTLARTLVRPRRWRLTALTYQMEETGLNAVPIVVILAFAVGAVVAYLGATVLGEFGATVYTIELVAYAFLREFGVLITAIVLAGRTASAFTAHIGSMKANEEIDALRTQGLDPIELLVLPRVLALMLVLPMLAFVAVLAGLAGGAFVTVGLMDIPLARFFSGLAEVPPAHYLVGLIKAPLFAFLIAAVGCLEGFKTEGSAQSVGEHTTASVVQSIFLVILLDAFAAMVFVEIGW